ncbi:MAG: sulfoxide reductase heme-binding subunit YedZ, partial [Methylococcales bacterium]
ANPIQALHFSLGDWALRFLMIGLALTPIKIITQQAWPLRYRRMMGLLAFFYASLHVLVYLVLDLSGSWTAFMDEVPKSPYILVGLLTYLLLIPLAITSIKYFKKKLGRRWFTLHKLVYVAVLSACLHYLWLVKLDVSQPLLYMGLLGILLSIRVVNSYRNRGA